MSQISELDAILSRLRYVKVGDIIMAEDHNDVVDALRKIRDILAAVPAVPVFDYIVDIYSDRVVITASDGTTTQLPTVADLNNWLRNITGKKIRVNVNVKVSDDMYFTPNEYWIFGEWITGSVYLLDGKHTVVSFAPLSVISNWYYDYKARRYYYHDISGSRLYILYADYVDIEGKKDMILKDVVIAVYHSYATSFENGEGDVYAQGYFVGLEATVVRDLYINAGFVCLEDVKGRNREGTWLVESHSFAYIVGVDLKDVDTAVLHLINTEWLYVSPRSSQEVYLPDISNSNWVYIRSLQVGAERCVAKYCITDPLPPGVTYTVDLGGRKVVITNNTDSGIDVDVVIEVIAFKYW